MIHHRLIRRCRPLVIVALVGAIAVGCGSDGNDDTSGDARIIVDGLIGPTQFAVDSMGDIWIAQLNGDENDGTGQVIVVNPEFPEDPPTVVVDDLDKPTGLAIFNDELWVMEGLQLTKGPMTVRSEENERVSVGERSVVVENLRSNGRSQGSLSVDGDRLLYDTSGAERGGEVIPDSGVLWAVGSDGEISQVATGLKHAYAQVRTPAGRLFSTEIGDGTYDGELPDDEVVEIEQGADYGWPHCVNDNRPVAEFGGTADECGEVPRSHAFFDAGATPTSIVVAPWDDNLLLVALWNEGRVVGVSASTSGAPVTDIFDGAVRPQHLVVDGDRVLLSDHEAGVIIEVPEPTE